MAGAATALLFDRSEVEEVADWPSEVDSIGRSSILWIDLQSADDEVVAQLAEHLDLSPDSADRLGETTAEPYFGDFGSYLHITAFAPCSGNGGTRELERVECLVSKRWVVTVHEQDIPVLETFRERAGGSGDTGRLDGLEFVACMLEWVLEGFLDAFEEIEVALEDLDERAMRGGLRNPEDALEDLVDLRREVGRLRRALVSHRQMFLALANPDLDGLSRSETAERFSALRSRLEEIVQAARDSRESVVGSFDVLIARTGYRTNEIMKVLTLASVLLLPGALIAGVLGMNFQVGIFEHAVLFWVVVGIIVAIAAGTLGVARTRRWI